MNPDDLTQAFISAGIDTPEKVQALLADLSTQLQIKRLNIQIEGLAQKQQATIKPFQDQRTELVNQRTQLESGLVPPS